MSSALRIEDLRVDGRPSGAAIIDDIHVVLHAGDVLGVVGESGSGKSTLALAVLDYFKDGTALAEGSVRIGDTELTTLPARQVRRLRGRHVAYIPQSPASALNPVLRIGTQLRECLASKDSGNSGPEAAAGVERMREVLREVALPDTDDFLRRYPHQLSGGQQQRVAIAMAFIARPEVIVLDEPTTGLDVTTQKHVLATVRDLCADYDVAAVYISHDMAVVGELADRIAVMYSGRLVEVAPAPDLLTRPQHPYTVGLLSSVPDLSGRRQVDAIPGFAPSPLNRPTGCAFAPRCPLVVDECLVAPPEQRAMGPEHTVRCRRAGEQPLRLRLRTPHPEGSDTSAPPQLAVQELRAWYTGVPVLEGINLQANVGECLALLGESGSGKTTLSRCVAGLHHQYSGSVTLDGEELPHSTRQRTREERRRVQYIFQNPYESLNPRRTVRELVTGPMRYLVGNVPDTEERFQGVLARVALRPDLADRYPEQLSGGERQRVAIARALIAEPEVLICDEITSALDVSVQASISELLAELQRDLGLTLLFVTHNIALVRNVAQSVAVLSGGVLVEQGPVDRVFEQPAHEYTRSLMADTPTFQLTGQEP
ncbi:MAG TPA: ABC transporter ATP-binding protein [Segeticoccus sp.]|uniref:ABC transporter ATP-binding protein n=1 Tax=Segeticoccus sp. TaxID=2706531 RepID=UPI002D7F3B51|nr:ABC transporter ATP-binding protein [Segeticoccus sp.]HET8599910.1 ABC transporter ATP-binding protein [Segeticoccus sp.]